MARNVQAISFWTFGKYVFTMFELVNAIYLLFEGFILASDKHSLEMLIYPKKLSNNNIILYYYIIIIILYYYKISYS